MSELSCGSCDGHSGRQQRERAGSRVSPAAAGILSLKTSATPQHRHAASPTRSTAVSRTGQTAFVPARCAASSHLRRYRAPPAPRGRPRRLPDNPKSPPASNLLPTHPKAGARRRGGATPPAARLSRDGGPFPSLPTSRRGLLRCEMKERHEGLRGSYGAKADPPPEGCGLSGGGEGKACTAARSQLDCLLARAGLQRARAPGARYAPPRARRPGRSR